MGPDMYADMMQMNNTQLKTKLKWSNSQPS